MMWLLVIGFIAYNNFLWYLLFTSYRAEVKRQIKLLDTHTQEEALSIKSENRLATNAEIDKLILRNGREHKQSRGETK